MKRTISYINSICVPHDAISEAVKTEILWLGETNRYDVKLYSYKCDFDSLPFKSVNDLAEVAFDQHFQSSDLIVFHFGICYPLFDLLAVAPKKAKRLVVFHNITPKQFVSVESHPTIEKSFRQMANIVFADHVVCDSVTNLDVLRAAGIHTPATVLPLTVCSELQTPESKPSVLDELIRIAFIGRFVRSKGPGELLEALHRVLQRNQAVQLTLDMVGNLSFSDSALLEEIRKTVEAMHRSHGGRILINIHGNASEEVKHQILRDSDLFVLPTYHEGFCVPIVEAFASGCKVIAYENSNTPAISGGFARLIRTGNVEELSDAIAEALAEVGTSAWKTRATGSYAEYAQNVRKYVLQYSPESTKRRFMDFIDNFTISLLPGRE
jgi:glycosyltransferase involved in cell wall biosynthesis